jgi:hypothetical protein
MEETKDGFVLDCSVTMAWCFDYEATPYTDGVRDCLADMRVVVPSIWSPRLPGPGRRWRGGHPRERPALGRGRARRVPRALPWAGMFRPLWGKESVLRRLSHRDDRKPVSPLHSSSVRASAG